MKQELETSHPLMLTHLFASQKDRGPISLSFCYQLLPLATKLWPEVPVSPSPMWSLHGLLHPQRLGRRLTSQSGGQTRASLSSTHTSWSFGELFALLSLFYRCDCPLSPLRIPPPAHPWVVISRVWDAGASQAFPQEGCRAGRARLQRCWRGVAQPRPCHASAPARLRLWRPTGRALFVSLHI